MSDGSYISSLAAYKPSTFVPDTPLQTSGAPKITLLPQDADADASTTLAQPAFASTLKGYMQDLGGTDMADDSDHVEKSKNVASIGDGIKSYFSGVNDQLVDSDRQTRDLLSGKTHDDGKVVSAAEEADLSLDMMLALTKRATAAYQSIENITI